MKSVFCTTWFVLSIGLAVALPGACHAADAADRFAFVARPGEIAVRIDDRPLAVYVYQDPAISRPYFKDIHAPGGVQVSRNHPPIAGVDRDDHADYHPGLWLAFGDLSGADSWRNKTPVRHIEFVRAPSVVEDRGSMTVRNHYLDDRGQTICEEICKYTFLVRPSGSLMLWDSTFQSDRADFYFGDQEEMGLAVRVATPITVKNKQGGRILNSEGGVDEKGTWGKQARWCDYSGWIDDVFVGITIMPDPGNVRPCWWHTRDYGFMTANPFGQAAFHAGPASKITVKRGEAFRLSYGILLHADASENAIDLSAAYRDCLEALHEIGERAEGGELK